MRGGWPGSEVQGSPWKSEAGGAEDGCVSMELAAIPPPLVLERRLSSVSHQDPPFLHPPIPLPPTGCGPQVFLFPFFCCHSLPFPLLEDQKTITLCSRVPPSPEVLPVQPQPSSCTITWGFALSLDPRFPPVTAQTVQMVQVVLMCPAWLADWCQHRVALSQWVHHCLG